jgi:hypothetical protein
MKTIKLRLLMGSLISVLCATLITTREFSDALAAYLP